MQDMIENSVFLQRNCYAILKSLRCCIEMMNFSHLLDKINWNCTCMQQKRQLFKSADVEMDFTWIILNSALYAQWMGCLWPYA